MIRQGKLGTLWKTFCIHIIRLKNKNVWQDSVTVCVPSHWTYLDFVTFRWQESCLQECLRSWSLILEPVFFAALSLCTKGYAVWRNFFEISVCIWKSNLSTNRVCGCVYSYICTCVSPLISDNQSRKLSLFQTVPLLRVFPFFIFWGLSYIWHSPLTNP